MNHRRLSSTLALAALSLCVLTSALRAGTVITLDFSQNSQLPSAQGFKYISGYANNIAESQVYSVANGLLKVNTTQYSPDVYAYYQLDNVYDRNLDTIFETKLRVTSTNAVTSLQFAFYDSSNSSIFTVNRTGWLIYGLGVGGTFANPDAFHVLSFRKPGGSNPYTFSVDGVVVNSGSLPGGYPGPLIYFGDGTPTGGNVTAEIASVYYSNSSAVVVPEPATLVPAAMATFAISGLILRGRRRRPELSSECQAV